jgi:3-oxoacyl-[acyl-carrier protein] reductase
MACLEHLPARIDVVVNAAGSNMATRGAPPQDLTAVSDMWMGNLRSNLMTAVVLTSALLDRVGENGRIIGFSSMAARSGGPGSQGYGAAKAAVEAWAKAISAEVGPRGITVNVVAPGLTDETDFFPVSLSASSREKLIMSADNRRAGRRSGDVPGVASRRAHNRARPASQRRRGFRPLDHPAQHVRDM